MLLKDANDTEQEYQESLLFVKELIAFYEKHGRIVCFPPYLQGNAIISRKNDPFTGVTFDSFIECLKSLKEDTINRKPKEDV